jgi:hypothetical protein
VVTESTRENSRLSPYRFLEKLKAGIGAAAFIILLSQVFSPLGIDHPLVVRVGAALSLLAFVVAYRYSDVEH